MIYYNKKNVQKFQKAGKVPMTFDDYYKSQSTYFTDYNAPPQVVLANKRRKLAELQKHGHFIDVNPETFQKDPNYRYVAPVSAPRTPQVIGGTNAINSMGGMPYPGAGADAARRVKSQRDWRAAQADPNFDYTSLGDTSQYSTPLTAEAENAVYAFGKNFTPYKPEASGSSVSGQASSSSAGGAKATPSTKATTSTGGAKTTKDPVDTSAYKDYLGSLSLDNVADIVRYGTKRGYNKEQIDSMMKVAVEQTELADKYGYKDKIDGLVGPNTRAARAAREKAMNEQKVADKSISEEINKTVTGDIQTTDSIAEAASSPNTIYSPREIDRAYRQDRRSDRSVRQEIRGDQRRLDRAERASIDPVDRRMDRQMDRAVRQNAARHSRINDRENRNSVREQMLKESENFPAIERFKQNIAAQAKKNGGIFYKK